MMTLRNLILFFILFIFLPAIVQGQQVKSGAEVVPRMRVIIDNDFSGDPDGLFQLTQLLLSPSVQSYFEADPSSSEYVIKKAPQINERGEYDYTNSGRNIRVYQHLDVT